MTPKPDDLEPHLRYELTSRGTLIMPEIYGNAHGALHLSESTTERGAYVWLRASSPSTLDSPHANRHEVVLHVSLNDLQAFVDQANFVLEHHYKLSRNPVTAVKDLKKCNTPVCFRLTSLLVEHCCGSCRVAHEGLCDATNEHSPACDDRRSVRGEWKARDGR